MAGKVGARVAAANHSALNGVCLGVFVHAKGSIKCILKGFPWHCPVHFGGKNEANCYENRIAPMLIALTCCPGVGEYS